MKTLNAHAKARYFRRQATDIIMSGLCVLAAIVGLIMLGLILWMLFAKGLAGLSLDVCTKSMRLRPTRSRRNTTTERNRRRRASATSRRRTSRGPRRPR